MPLSPDDFTLSPPSTVISHSRPSLSNAEAEAVARVVRSGQVAQGPEVAELEKELAARLGVRFVVAVSSGTAALHLALLVLGVGRDDRVAIPTYVCSSLLHAVSQTGASSFLVDSDPDTLSLSAVDLQRRRPKRLKAVILPHMFGIPADVGTIAEAGVPCIEDCAMSLGATANGNSVGSSGVLSIFSFYATKMICAGEGGAAATNDPKLADTLRDLREYDGRTGPGQRYNYKLTDLQAAMARVQLSRLDSFIARRNNLARRYSAHLSDSGGDLPRFADGAVAYRYVVRHPKGAEALIPRFESRGVSARRPVADLLHRVNQEDPGPFPVAEQVFESAISLPLYPDLSDSEVATILEAAGALL